jgi:hypothetical protein
MSGRSTRVSQNPRIGGVCADQTVGGRLAVTRATALIATLATAA